MSAIMRSVVAGIADPSAAAKALEDAAGTLAVVEAVREAARTGARVSPGQITEQTA